MLLRQIAVKRGAERTNPGGNAMLQRGGRADIQHITHRADGLRPRGLRHAVADAPTGDTERFRVPPDGNRPVGHTGERRHAHMLPSIEHKIFINFVRDHHHVMAAGHLSDLFQLPPCEDFSRGVSRSVHHDRLGPGGDRLLEAFEIHRPIRRSHRHTARHGLDRNDRLNVIGIEGLKENHFVAGIQQRHAGGLKRSGGAGAHGNIDVRFRGDSIVRSEFAGNGLSQFRNAVKA